MAITITAEEVKALSLSGEFGSLLDEQIDAFSARAIRVVDEDVFGDCAHEAALHLTAHYLATAKKSGHGAPAGPVEGSRAGGLERDYAVEGSGKGDPDRYLNATWYGRHFLWLRRTRAIGPSTANTTDAATRHFTP